MVLKRKAYQKMLEWKSRSNGKTSLMLDGARRVGKSFLCEQFGANEYKSMLYIDFSKEDKRVIDIFESDGAEFDIFFSKLAAHYKVTLYKGESLVVFDEVQRYPRARQMLKHLVADGRYHYIEAGSLISLKRNVEDILIPSEEDHMEVYPLDFEEFLWAMNDETTVPFIRMCFERMIPLGQALCRKVMNDFRQYLLVGGMPQAVLAYLGYDEAGGSEDFVAEKNFEAADIEKKRILELYSRDIIKFATGYEGKVTSIFNTIPGQLQKKEKKYKLSTISKSARMRGYEDAFIWLDEAMIVNPCFNATDPGVGLSWSADHNTQKLYMADTGLLVSHAFRDNEYIDNELYRAILLDKLSVNEGMLMENAVAQMLRANGHRLFFYSRADSNNRAKTMEIDFLISRGRKICPIEVKSSVYKAHSSLDKFMKKFRGKLGEAYILYAKDVMVKDDVIHLPLYMAMFL